MQGHIFLKKKKIRTVCAGLLIMSVYQIRGGELDIIFGHSVLYSKKVPPKLLKNVF